MRDLVIAGIHREFGRQDNPIGYWQKVYPHITKALCHVQRISVEDFQIGHLDSFDPGPAAPQHQFRSFLI